MLHGNVYANSLVQTNVQTGRKRVIINERKMFIIITIMVMIVIRQAKEVIIIFRLLTKLS